MIKATNLRKAYGRKVAVDNISFEVATGKVTGFLGPNGAGKSTAMRLMLGMCKITSADNVYAFDLTPFVQTFKRAFFTGGTRIVRVNV